MNNHFFPTFHYSCEQERGLDWEADPASPKPDLSNTWVSAQAEETELFGQALHPLSRQEPVLSGLLHEGDPCPQRLLSAETAEALELDLQSSREIEEELGAPAANKTSLPPLKFLKKKAKETTSNLMRFRKKLMLKRFSLRLNKDAKILNKVRRTKLYWKRESQAIPNVFKFLTNLPGSQKYRLEKSDFSKKEVLADELELPFFPEYLTR